MANLLNAPNAFNNGTYWFGSVSVSAPTVSGDPLGGNTATRLSWGGGGAHFLDQFLSGIGAGTYTASLYFKADSGATWGILDLGNNNGVRVWINLSTGAVGSSPLLYGTGTSVTVGTVVNAGSGWWKLPFTAVETETDLYFQIGSSRADGDATQTAGDSILVYSADLEAGSGGGTAYSNSISFGVTTGMSDSAIASFANAVSLSNTTGLSSTGGINLSGSISLGSTFGTASSASLIFNLGSALAVSTSLAAASQLAAVAGAPIAIATAISAGGPQIMASAAALATATGLAASASSNIALAASLAASTALSAAATRISSDGLTFGLIAGIIAAAAQSIPVSATLGASNGLAASAVDVMSAAISLADANFDLSSDAPAAGTHAYNDMIEFAAATALTAASQSSVQVSATLAATIAELVQSASTIAAAASLATTITEIATGALSIPASIPLTAHAQTNVAGQLVVTGTIGIGPTTGMGASILPGPATGDISFSAHFTAEAGNILTASQAISIAAHVALLASLGASRPVIDEILIKGIRQYDVTLAGVVQVTITLAGSELN